MAANPRSLPGQRRVRYRSKDLPLWTHGRPVGGDMVSPPGKVDEIRSNQAPSGDPGTIASVATAEGIRFKVARSVRVLSARVLWPAFLTGIPDAGAGLVCPDAALEGKW